MGQTLAISLLLIGEETRDTDWLDEGEADFLILHIDVASEIAAYWRFVYRTGEDVVDGPRRANMERHS